MAINIQLKSRHIAISGFLIGVLLSLINPDSAEGFQSDSLALSQNLTALRYSAAEFGDYDNDGDIDFIIAGESASGRETILYQNDGSGSFSVDAGSSITAVDYPAFAWGDIDGDGDLDLAISGQSAASTYVAKLYTNNGSGVFTEVVTDSLNDAYWGDLEFGDLDGDGDLDLVQSGLPSNGIRVMDIFWNDGSGTFTKDTVNNFTGNGAGDIELVDYDRDGDLDLSYMGYTDANAGIFEVHVNNGSGTFSLKQSLDPIVAGGSGGADWADYDNDGDLDLIITGVNWATSNRVTKIYTTGSDGSFTHDSPRNEFSVPVSGGDVQWGDYDLDGDQDIIITGVTDGGYNTYIYTNDGTGQISGFVSTISDGIENGIVDWVDMDGDDYLDVLITGRLSGGGRLTATYLSTRSSVTAFTEIASGLGTPIKRHSDWVDYDNDGDLDFAYGLTGTSFGIYRNDGSDTFVSVGLDLRDNFGGSVNALALGGMDWADYDKDGDLDLVISGYDGGDQVYIFTNSGGTLSYSHTLLDENGINKARTGDAIWMDYDGDGDLDVIFNGSTIMSFVENNGDNTFTTEREWDINSDLGHTIGYSNLEYGDYDNDGDNDLLVIGNNGVSGGASRILDNDGAGNFSDSGISFGLHLIAEGKFGDYDNDGDLDIAISGQASSGNNTILYRNNGDGTFTNANIPFISLRYSAIEWLDFNNDGFLDLLIMGENTSSVDQTLLYKNNGFGGFSLSGSSFVALATTTTGDVAVGDYDNDGDMDVFTPDRIYKNQITRPANKPSLPSNLQTSVTGSDLSLDWNASIDSDGGTINYELYAYRTDTLDNHLSIHTDTTNTFGRVYRMGNNADSTSRTLSGLPDGRYRIGIQAIDNAFNRSEFATINAIVGPYVEVSTDTLLYANLDSVYTLSPGVLTVNQISNDAKYTFQITESVNGTLFVDSDDDDVADEGEILSVGQSYLLSSLNESDLKYTTDEETYSPVRIDFNFPTEPEDRGVVLFGFDKTPEVSGTANEGGWYLLSNSMNTTLGNYLDAVWTQGAPNSDAPEGTPTLYTFNQDSAAYVAVTTDLDTTSLAAGTGILTYLYAFDDYEAGVPEGGGWPKILTNYGNPFGENVTIPLRNVDVDESGTTTGSEGFALVGNPYGFPISVDSLISGLTSIDPIANRYVYLWDPINKRYELKLTGAIDPYTSFFIRTVQSGYSGDLEVDYDDFWEVSSPKIVPEIKFDLNLLHIESNIESNWKLKSSANAKEGIDPNDGYYLGSYASNFANLYTLIDDQPLSINNLPNQSKEFYTVPLYLDATVSGEFTLNWQTDDLPKDWEINLEYVKDGTTVDLRAQGEFNFTVSEKQKRSMESALPTSLYTFQQSRGKVKGEGIQPVFKLKVNTGRAVNSEVYSGIPTDVELYQNYPNPFNPSSVIRFGVPEMAEVQLEVFDVVGRKVMTLLNGETKQPGRYNIQFDARGLSSGMYIYRLKINNKVLTKKMTLIK